MPHGTPDPGTDRESAGLLLRPAQKEKTTARESWQNGGQGLAPKIRKADCIQDPKGSPPCARNACTHRESCTTHFSSPPSLFSGDGATFPPLSPFLPTLSRASLFSLRNCWSSAGVCSPT